MRRSALRVSLFLVLGLLLSAVFAPEARSQSLSSFFVVPKANEQTLGNLKTERPFAEGLSRYQQVYKAADILKSVGPVRISAVRFRAASNAQQGGQLDVQVAVGLLQGQQSKTFDQNLRNATVVWPRKNMVLPTSAAGSWVLHFPFPQPITWDGASDLVVDIKVFGNHNNNQRFFYDFDSVLGNSAVSYMSATAPSATTAALQLPGRGLVTRFDFVPGISYGFGDGCKGDGGVVPTIGSNAIPKVGSTGFAFTLGQARPNSAALLFWGFSRSQWGPAQLPLDLTPLGIWGCNLNVSPDFVWSAATVGSGPGTGTAQLGLPIPAVSTLVGLQFWAQWGVVDTSTTRPVPLTFSRGLALVIG